MHLRRGQSGGVNFVFGCLLLDAVDSRGEFRLAAEDNITPRHADFEAGVPGGLAVHFITAKIDFVSSSPASEWGFLQKSTCRNCESASRQNSLNIRTVPRGI